VSSRRPSAARPQAVTFVRGNVRSLRSDLLRVDSQRFRDCFERRPVRLFHLALCLILYGTNHDLGRRQRLGVRSKLQRSVW
jgi:hypothetical protein